LLPAANIDGIKKQQKKEEEMWFVKQNFRSWTSSTFQPIILFVPIKSCWRTRTRQISSPFSSTWSKSQVLWDPLFAPDLSFFLIGFLKLKLS
jgi:hypothetical protein